MAKGDTKTNQYLDIAANGTRADFPASCCETRSQTLIREVGERIMDLEDEVERLENNPDVADIVATYADLQSYDTSQLTDKDVIRVLQDETHDGDSTYYRWSTSTNTWTYIGESKQYTDFIGTDGTEAGEAGLVPAPATTDAGKFLKADGTWDTAGGSITPVQTTGTSTTDVMSQNAVTSMVYAGADSGKIKIGKDYSTYSFGSNSVNIGSDARTGGQGGVCIGVSAEGGNYSNSTCIGSNALTGANSAVAIGYRSQAYNGNYPVAIGYSAKADNGWRTLAIGSEAHAAAEGSIALGANSSASTQGEMNIGTSITSNGYNNSNYRLIRGVYDGQNANDAVTVGQVNSVIDAINTALSTNIPHIGAQS